jgi:hypothetical protein
MFIIFLAYIIYHQTIFIDEKIVYHATNMMIINKISQSCLCYFSTIQLNSDQLNSENELSFPKLMSFLSGLFKDLPYFMVMIRREK